MLREGLQFYSIPHDQKMLGGLNLYVRELIRWNARINLTGLKEPGQVIRELLYDAFFLCIRLNGIESVVDLGSGSGILGIPIKILNEDITVFSVDKSLKKIQFQRHIKRVVSLKQFYPIHGRAETLEPLGAEILIAKGFGTIDRILETGGRHIRHGGSALILKGKEDQPQEYDGFIAEQTIPYSLPGSGRAYRLFVYRKGQA